MRDDELFVAAKELQVLYELVKRVAADGTLLVVNFVAGGISISADAVLVMQLGAEDVFLEHVRTLRSIGVDSVEVCLLADLEGVAGLILPGGESTAQRRLIDRWGLREPILGLAREGAPLFGTCAGMILLASDLGGSKEPVLPLIDMTVERNAFGRQLDSFEAELDVPVLGHQPVHGIFIRAPIVERTGPDVDVLSRLDDGRIVAVRERNVVA